MSRILLITSFINRLRLGAIIFMHLDWIKNWNLSNIFRNDVQAQGQFRWFDKDLEVRHELFVTSARVFQSVTDAIFLSQVSCLPPCDQLFTVTVRLISVRDPDPQLGGFRLESFDKFRHYIISLCMTLKHKMKFQDCENWSKEKLKDMNWRELFINENYCKISLSR